MEIQTILNDIRTEAGKVIIGQKKVLDLALTAIFCRQHALLEGVPGVAKTLLVRTLAQLLGCEFGRIQFTPDLMPTDITGTMVYRMSDSQFSLLKGPVFTSFLLADEINRAPAKTQSALLQAMQERLVTIDRQTYPLPENFTVFATQNPVEYEGTYPLPEAQKDRFLLKIQMELPEEDEERTLARRMAEGNSPEQILGNGEVRPLLTPQLLGALRSQLESIRIREDVLDYMVALVRASRTVESVLVGAGPRATQAFVLASRVTAALEGRDFVVPDDVRQLAIPILAHRIVLRPEFEVEGMTAVQAVEETLQLVRVPR